MSFLKTSLKAAKKMAQLSLAILLLVNIAQKATNASSVYNDYNGRFIWYSSSISDENSDIWTADQDGANPRKLTDDDRHDGNPQWYPTGQRAVFNSPSPSSPADSTNHAIFIVDENGTNKKLLIDSTADDLGSSICTDDDENCPLFDASFSPDGSKLAFLMLDGDVGSQIVIADYNYSANSVTNFRILASAGSGEPYWSKDSSKIVFTYNAEKVKVYNVSSGSLVYESSVGNWGSSPQFGPHPDKDLVVVSGGDGKLYIIDIANGSGADQPFATIGDATGSWTWSPNGRKLASGKTSGNEIIVLDYQTKQTNIFAIKNYDGQRIGELDWLRGEPEEVDLPDIYVECETEVGKPCTANLIPEYCKNVILAPPVRGTSILDPINHSVTYTPTESSDQEENYIHLREDPLGNTAKCFVKIKFRKASAVNVPATGVVGGMSILLVIALSLVGAKAYSDRRKRPAQKESTR